jgi:pantoate--beta-alanine ligase
MTMRRVDTVADLRAAVDALRRDGASIGFVPTMGALHAGHLDLVRRTAAETDAVIVSIFVNPRQFDRADDLEAYPRDLAADEAALAALGDAAPTLVFTPQVQEMYPADPAVTVTVGGGLADRLCGASRPGHFDGVVTVVAKLFNQVRPDVAAFGRKDRQQLQIIQRMVADLDVPVRILPVPTVRDPDGVAISSRNLLLTDDQRADARVLSLALAEAVRAARLRRQDGAPLSLQELRDALARTVATAPAVEPDYLEVVDPRTLAPPDDEVPADARLIVAVAAFLDSVRLIDNVELGDLDDEDALLAAVS